MHRFKFSAQFPKFIWHTFRQFSTHQTPIENVGTMASLLTTRSVVRFQGPDTVKFLHGLLTNDIRKFGEHLCENASTVPTPNLPVVSNPPVYAAMLTSQGRFLYDFFVYAPDRPDLKLDESGSGPGPHPGELELYADVDGFVLDELFEVLGKYRLRSKVDIENVTEAFSCWQLFGSNMTVKSSSTEEPEASSVGWGGAVDQSGASASSGNDCGWQWHRDPRLDCLGFRGIFPSNTTPPLVESDTETDENNYLVWRLEKGVAEGSIEIPKGEAMPLEYNLAGLNAISFDKGCYVGQELIARTHHRGVIRKRVLPLKFIQDDGKEVEQKVSPGSQVVSSASGKKVGTVTTALGCRGLGLLRLEEAFKGLGSLVIQGQEDVKVQQPIRPEWWPPAWFMQSQQQTTAAD